MPEIFSLSSGEAPKISAMIIVEAEERDSELLFFSKNQKQTNKQNLLVCTAQEVSALE